jgi:hypothetical protein
MSATWFNYIKEHPDKYWCYEGISGNPNLTWDEIIANPDKPWDYRQLSKNPTITWDIIEANPDKPWDYFELSFNKMGKEPFFQNKQLTYILK